MSDPNLENMLEDEPIAELACLKVQPEDNFLERFHDAVHRRALASQCLDYSLQGFFGYCMAMISVLFEAIDNDANAGQEDKGNE